MNSSKCCGCKSLTKLYLLWLGLTFGAMMVSWFTGELHQIMVEAIKRAGTLPPEASMGTAVNLTLVFVLGLNMITWGIGFALAVQATKGAVWAKWILGFLSIWMALNAVAGTLQLSREFPQFVNIFDWILSAVTAVVALWLSLSSFLSLRKKNQESCASAEAGPG